MKTRTLRMVAAGAAVLWFTAAIANQPRTLQARAVDAWDADDTAAHAMVKGPENRLREFNQNVTGYLSSLLGTSDPAATGVSCDVPPGEFNCDSLSSDKEGEIEIHYTLVRNRNQLVALLLAWNMVQSREADREVTITFDLNRIPAGDCGGLQNCVNAPFCAGPPRRCDKVQGAPCTPCQ